MAKKKEEPIRSITRALNVLQAINRHGALTMTQISKAVDLPYPTACRIVQTLQTANVIEREASRKYYRATALSQSLSCGYQPSTRLVAIARPHIEKLTREIGWPVSVGSRVGSVMVIQDSTHAMTTLTFSDYHPGYSLPLASSAAGMVYLAFMDPTEREDILKQIEQTRRENIYHIAPKSNLSGFFDLIMEDGYASYIRNPHTKNPGKTSSIALPLYRNGKIHGTMTLIFFSSAMRVTEAYEKYKKQLLGAQKAINDELDSLKLFNPEDLQLNALTS